MHLQAFTTNCQFNMDNKLQALLTLLFMLADAVLVNSAFSHAITA